jgi:NADP-dependent 3-hydroxy acid dehydrogenase YdfG
MNSARPTVPGSEATGAASGVGIATLALAKHLGAKVIGASRSADKLDRLNYWSAHQEQRSQRCATALASM